jgi:hypothetical protein
MTKEHPRLKLGKRAAFVKTRLKRLPRQQETWEVDFRTLPKPTGQAETHYLGLAVALPRGDPLVYLPVEYTPTVNDLADLLADAMRRPLTGSARRPSHMHFRANPRWDELFPHLNELGVEVTVQDDLPELEEVCLDFLREMRKANPGPVVILSPRPADPGRQFPAIGRWVRESGWIEVGRRKEAGFVARALDEGGLVFENSSSTTLAQALAALEEGLAGRFGNQEGALRPSSPTVKKAQRRPRSDACTSTQARRRSG